MTRYQNHSGDWEPRVNRGHFPPEAPMAKMAKQHALRAIARDIPDPDQYAHYLPLEQVSALLRCWKYQSYGWRVTLADARILRPYGLVAYNDCGLTAFGWSVYQALKRQDA